MGSSSSLFAGLAPRCTALVEATQGVVTWEWDPRFGAALAAFDASNSAAVRAAIEDGLPGRWTTDNIDAAPARVQSLAQAFGGLRGGQILDTSEATEPTMLLSAWWPWGNGQRISIRVGFVVDDENADDNALEAEFKALFGL